MYVPNKITTYKESMIYRMLYLIEDVDNEDAEILSLYNKYKKKFNSIDEFIYSLEILFIFNIIDVDFEGGRVRYVNRNK